MGCGLGPRQAAELAAQRAEFSAGVGGIALILEYVLTMVGIGTVIVGLVGLSLGLLFAKLIYFPLKTIFDNMDGTYIGLIFNALFGYSGLLLGLRAGEDEIDELTERLVGNHDPFARSTTCESRGLVGRARRAGVSRCASPALAVCLARRAIFGHDQSAREAAE